jgi:transglutaminase-like putative cysteine protease
MRQKLKRRATAVAVIVSLTAGTLPGHLLAAQRAPAATAVGKPADPLAVLRELQKTIGKIAPADWSVERRAPLLAAGTDAAFALVRDEIAFEPYAGVLRGAAGTYASRAGNAADRALLLAALLNLRGTKTRFVLGQLEPHHRDRLYGRVFDMPPARPAPGGEAGGLHQRLFARAGRDYDRLRGALGDRLPPVTEPARQQVLAEMDPHVWVQASTARGWVDLDPSFADARPGQTWATPRQTLEQLPADLHQRVTIRVVAEHLSSGALTPRTLLTVTRNAVDLNQVPIALLHTQPQGMSALGGSVGRAFGRQSEEWMPLLWIAGEFVQGNRFDVAASTFITEWLEFELTWPGGRKEFTRRPLADRGSAAWRAVSPLSHSALRPLARNDEGPLDIQAVHNIWLSGSQHNLAEYVQALEDLLLDAAAKAMGVDTAPPSDDFGVRFRPFAMHNLGVMFWTDHVGVPILNDTPGVRLYQDSPRIAVFTSGPAGRDDLRIGTDLRRDHLRGLAQAGAERTLAEKKLRFGTLQGALEHEFMHDLAAASNETAEGVVSTSARLTGAQLAVLTRQSAGTLAGRGPATALVRRALEQGAVVVATPADLDARDAWWEIDSRTGDTHAVSGPGLHNGLLDLLGKGGKQMNQLTPPKAYDARDALERRREFAKLAGEANKRRAEAKNAADPGRIQRLAKGYEAQPKGGQARGGGGAEYTVLLTAVHIAGSMAMWALSAWLEAKLIQELTAAAGWIADGGFRRAIGR